MKISINNVLTVLSLATVLWAVPSVGTRGQGTLGHGSLGDRFVHVDRAIVADDAAGTRLDAGGRAMLRRADARLTSSVVAL